MTAVASLALLTSTGGEAVAGARADMSTHDRCQIERGDIRVAKAKVKRAKHAKYDRARKVKRAKANVRVQKRQAANWCARARNEAAAEQKSQERSEHLSATATSPSLAAAPASVREPLLLNLNDALAHVTTLDAEIPGAEPAALAQLVSTLDALDTSAVDASLTNLAVQLQTSAYQGHLNALLDSLTGPLPEGTTLPSSGALGALSVSLGRVVGDLAEFDPAGSAGQLTSLAAHLDQVTADLATAHDDLELLLADLATLNGGTPPSEAADYADLWGALLGGGSTLPFPLPADLEGVGVLEALLTTVSRLLGDVSVPTVADLLGDLLDTLLGGGPDGDTPPADDGELGDLLLDPELPPLPPLLP